MLKQKLAIKNLKLTEVQNYIAYLTEYIVKILRRNNKMLKRIENKTIRKYGFENWRTILVFRITNFFKKFSKNY